ncbi:hypothetical protein BJV74DRAFT_83293 [Russula compacta]|nr:hypothetical protein BJV74DRAFT_83293 [Russula compacta]
MSAPTVIAVNLGTSYGAAFIGLILKSILFGVTLAQTWIYFCSRECRRKDSTVMKGFILFITGLDTLHTSFCTYVLYWYLIRNFADLENLGVDHWSMVAQTIVHSSLTLLIQLFYARRLHLMSKSILLAMIVVVLAVFVFIAGIVFATREYSFKLFSRAGSLTWLAWVAMGSYLFSDLLIAVSMCWCLYHKRTGFSRTDTMITNLMIYVIGSGMMTSLLGAASVISFAVAPATFYSMAINDLLSTCFVNALLALLNNRETIRGGPTTYDVSSDSTRTGDKLKTGQTPNIINVNVHRTATMDYGGSNHDSETMTSALELKKMGLSTSTIHGGLPDSAV